MREIEAAFGEAISMAKQQNHFTQKRAEQVTQNTVAKKQASLGGPNCDYRLPNIILEEGMLSESLVGTMNSSMLAV